MRGCLSHWRLCHWNPFTLRIFGSRFRRLGTFNYDTGEYVNVAAVRWCRIIGFMWNNVFVIIGIIIDREVECFIWGIFVCFCSGVN